jgi:hypothetical protein
MRKIKFRGKHDNFWGSKEVIGNINDNRELLEEVKLEGIKND